MTDTDFAAAEARRQFIKDTQDRAAIYYAHTGRSLADDERAVETIFGEVEGRPDDFNLLDDEAFDAFVADATDAYLTAPADEQVEWDTDERDWDRAHDDFTDGIGKWLHRYYRSRRGSLPLVPYAVRSFVGADSTEGVRIWQAEDEDHAREQHADAFPDENVIAAYPVLGEGAEK